MPVDPETQKNPFALYDSFLNLVQPVSYQKQAEAIKTNISDLHEMLARETERTDTLQRSVQKFIDEESALKLEMDTLRDALGKQKSEYRRKLQKVNLHMQGIINKYKLDIQDLKHKYNKLREYADFESTVKESIIAKFAEQR